MSAAGLHGAERSKDQLPVWRVTERLIRYRLGLWLANLGAMLVLMTMVIVPGLAIRAFFDLLSGEAPAGVTLWTLIAAVLAAEIARSLGMFGLIKTNVPFFVHTMTLPRKNLLRHILKRPGANALPDSPGEAISSFRGDVFDLSLFALWMNDFLGLLGHNLPFTASESFVSFIQQTFDSSLNPITNHMIKPSECRAWTGRAP